MDENTYTEEPTYILNRSSLCSD